MMTGIMIDLLTTILITIVAFMFGYSSGHRVGREETRAAMATLVKAAVAGNGKDNDINKIINKGDTK